MNVFLIIWSLAIICLLFFYLIFYLRLIFYKSERQLMEEGVSVVICARNEAENLKNNLPHVLKQRYKEFEVLVVNDRSSDKSAEILAHLRDTHSHLKVIEKRDTSELKGKKGALRLGIKEARYERILLTDADCKPNSEKWIESMVSYSNEKEIILGFGGYFRKKGWLNKLVRWETLQTASQYLGLAVAGIPYMGVGRNLSYTAKLFKKSDQFALHSHIPFGDDDLFIGSVANGKNTAVEMRPKSFTYSAAPENFRLWWKQKRRHLGAASYYKSGIKFILSVYGLAQLLFYLLLPVVFLFEEYRFTVFSLLLTKLILQYMIMTPIAHRLKSVEVIWLSPVWEMLITIFTAVIHLQNTFFGIPKNWK